MSTTYIAWPQNGMPPGAAVAACRTYGVLIVTLQYGAGADAQDGDVLLDRPHHSKQQVGNVFTFQLVEELYEISVTSANWSVRGGYEYEGNVEKNKYTAVTIPLHVHTIQLTAIDTPHFVPVDDTATISYTITGDLPSIRTIELVAARSAGGGDILTREVMRTNVPVPRALPATFDFTGGAALHLAGAPFDLMMILTSNRGRVTRSNVLQLDIMVHSVVVEINAALIGAMPGGDDKVALQILSQEVTGNAGLGRLLYNSPLFNTGGNELDDDASFTSYELSAWTGLEVPLLAHVNLTRKDNSTIERPAVLAGSTMYWDVRLDSNVEFAQRLTDRNVHANAQNFITAIAGHGGTDMVTRPQGRTAHKILGGMRASVASRGIFEEQWTELDAAWSYTEPLNRNWGGVTDCGASATPHMTGASSGVRFRPGRIAMDVHHVRAYLQPSGATLDDASNVTYDNHPGNLKSPLDTLVIINYRNIPICQNYWVGNLAAFNATNLSAEYEKGAVVVQRARNVDIADKTADWQNNYAAFVPTLTGPFATHAIEPACGTHAAAFRTFSEYQDRLNPGFTNALKRAAALLSATDKATYATHCDAASANIIFRMTERLFPSTASRGLAPWHGGGGARAAAPPGLTVLQFEGAGQYNLQSAQNNGNITRGWAAVTPNYTVRDKAIFFTFGPVPDTTIIHEIGHNLFLAHAPGHYTPGQQPAGYQVDAHDANDVCIMSYASNRTGLCGFCLLKLAGYDPSKMHRDGTWP